MPRKEAAQGTPVISDIGLISLKLYQYNLIIGRTEPWNIGIRIAGLFFISVQA